MKCLSIRQPWAWAIVEGYKPVENRSRRTNYRGEFYIHAGKQIDPEGYKILKKMGLHPPRPEVIPRGGIVGTAKLTGVCTAHSSAFFTGPYGWLVDNPRRLPLDPCRGQLGFFEVKP